MLFKNPQNLQQNKATAMQARHFDVNIMYKSIPTAIIPPPPRANPRELTRGYSNPS
jgi:hypothetical protein